MIKRILLSSAFVVAGGLVTPMVMANPGSEHAGKDMSEKQTIENKEQFSKLDSDGDGYLRQQDLADAQDVAADFETLDTNQDGQVDQTEFAALESADQTGMGQTDTGMGQSGMDGTDTGAGQSGYGDEAEDDTLGGASDEWGTEDDEY